MDGIVLEREAPLDSASRHTAPPPVMAYVRVGDRDPPLEIIERRSSQDAWSGLHSPKSRSLQHFSGRAEEVRQRRDRVTSLEYLDNACVDHGAAASARLVALPNGKSSFGWWEARGVRAGFEIDRAEGSAPRFERSST